MRKKSLDHDDISIWKKVTDTVTPILRQRFGNDSVSEKDDGRKKTLPKKHKPVSEKIEATPSVNAPKSIKNKKTVLSPADLDTKGYGGISRSGARSIKSGQSGYTRKIDLHGLTREKAQIKLRHFIQTSAKEGHRHVLVITGKGAEGRGVIRSYFPVWLNEDPLSNLVIAYCQAQPKDGGSGAWYVNLRS